MTTTETRVETACSSCGAVAHLRRAQPAGWRCYDCRPLTPMPEAANVDWRRLIASAERIGVPVSRVDHRGEVHLIRSTRQLTEWETP